MNFLTSEGNSHISKTYFPGYIVLNKMEIVMHTLKNNGEKVCSLELTKFITTHLPLAPGCSTITRMCFLGEFDDKKQKRKAQE